jgi:hypothetical protein
MCPMASPDIAILFSTLAHSAVAGAPCTDAPAWHMQFTRRETKLCEFSQNGLAVMRSRQSMAMRATAPPAWCALRNNDCKSLSHVASVNSGNQAALFRSTNATRTQRV